MCAVETAIADMSEIVPGRVYLGGDTGAQSLAALQSKGVTDICNCTDVLPLYHEAAGLRYHRVALQDNPRCPLLPMLPAALDWIDAALAAGGVVYLHCHAGSSRSGAVTCALLMRRTQQPFAEALVLAKSLRPKVHPNAGFRASLRRFEASVLGSAPPPCPAAELEVAAQEFADAEMAHRMGKGEFEWAGYEAWKARYREKLVHGDIDF
jgi:dual specificity phosphatase 12